MLSGKEGGLAPALPPLPQCMRVSALRRNPLQYFMMGVARRRAGASPPSQPESITTVLG